jgi:glucose dehydrogenase
MKSDMKEDMKMDKSQDKAMIKKAFRQHDSQEHKGGKGTDLTLKKGGNVKKMARGGMTADPRETMMAAKMARSMPKRPMAAAAPAVAPAAPMMKKGGMTKMARGGGVESKGKTKGTMISMKGGGKAC